jgi:hypothetical protein
MELENIQPGGSMAATWGSMLKQEQLIQTARAFNGNFRSRRARVTLVSRLLIAGYAPDHGVARGKHS